MSPSEQPKSSSKRFTNGLRNIQSFLRGRAFPGRLTISRKGQDNASFSSGGASSHAMEGDVSDGGAGVETPPSSTAAAGEQQGATSQASSTSAAPAGLSAGANAPAQPSTAPQEARARATAASGTAAPVAGALQSRSMYSSRIVKFEKILSQQVVDLDALRELSWSGIPPHLRADCWRLLLGYLPPHSSKRPAILARKRKEYQDLVPEYYDIDNSERSTDELGALRQVDVDVPRTMPEVAFFHQPVVQKVLSRILYIWGIRHPASGYVQGINDLVAPFLAVFLTEHMSGDISSWHCDGMAEEVMMDAEADSYWCLCKLLDGIQDHYTYAQPGIQRSILALQDLVRRVEEGLTAHMESEGVEFMQFSFRWVNCLLIREVPFSIALRLWDTYLAEGSNLTDFIAYICASFFLMWAQELKRMDFQEMLMFLQKVPTASWTETQVEMVLSKAYMWRATFNEAQSHLG